MPFNIGPMELIVVLVIALVVLGPKKFPEVGKSLGKGMRGFKDSVAGIHDNDPDDPPQISPSEVAHQTNESEGTAVGPQLPRLPRAAKQASG